MHVYILCTYCAPVNLPVYRTRLQVLWSALSPTHLFWVLLVGFLGGVKGHCLSYLSAHVTIYGSGQLNEEWLFIVAHGVFSVSVCVCACVCVCVCMCVCVCVCAGSYAYRLHRVCALAGVTSHTRNMF